MNNLSTFESNFGRMSPVECYKLNAIAVFYIVLFVFSSVVNFGVIWAIYVIKEKKGPLQWLIIFHSILNIIATLSELPFLIVSCFKCSWPFGKNACVITAFIMYFVGATSIFIMVAISIERFYMICRNALSVLNIIFLIFISTITGLFWSVMPFVGWSYYSQESNLISCCVEWTANSIDVISYNITMFAFVFFLPISIITYTQVNVFCEIRRTSNRESLKWKERERYLVMVMLTYMIIFLVSWTPYAFVTFVSAFVKGVTISPLGSTIPGACAKSSTIWSTLYFISTDKKIRNLIKTKIFRIEAKESLDSKDEATFKMSNNISLNE